MASTTGTTVGVTTAGATVVSITAGATVASTTAGATVISTTGAATVVSTTGAATVVSVVVLVPRALLMISAMAGGMYGERVLLFTMMLVWFTT